jgi:hypothetical protein
MKRKSSGFKNLLWEFKLIEIDLKISQITHDDDINPLYKEGFENLPAGLEEFLTENEVTCDKDLGYFKVYSSASVESTDIIRTSGSFFGKEWFSNVVVFSEEAEWYGKVSTTCCIFKSSLNLHNKLYDVINLIFRRFYY